MLKIFTVITLAAALVLTVPGLSIAAENAAMDTQGYSVELTSTSLKLVFPDGSVLTAPKDFDGKSLEGITATEGMARELLDIAYEQMGVQKAADLPKAFGLSQNFPNPFNPSTVISYNIPEGSGELAVKLTVFNIRGQVVRSLVDEVQGPGTYSVNWDGIDNQARRVASGVYFYRINAGDFVSMRKMVILK
ncbi:MAG: T9SS type A sorting domain-containing protein [Candidatus Glassbacteria bacterium]|nr:T9SS type A sorting domain-containing protein [Candidatus Glassbacteria bacterium]